MEVSSEKYRAAVDDDGLLKVFRKEPPELRVTSSTKDGGVCINFINAKNANESERTLLAHMARAPVFVAGYAGGEGWKVDLDCGFQRWRGTKTTRQLRKALGNCGFDTGTKRKILAECRKHKVEYVPRYC